MEQNTVRVAKLKGRENYDTWKMATKAYLIIKGLWGVIDGTETDETKNAKAYSEMFLLLEPVCYSLVAEHTSAKDAWKALEKVFDDSGVYRRVGLIKQLALCSLEDCESMEEYIDRRSSIALKVKNVGYNIDDDVLGSLMLAGLTEEYKPLVMALGNTKNLSADVVKTHLLQEVNYSGGAQSLALIGRKQRPKFEFKCFECDGKGHMARNCPNKKPQKKPQKGKEKPNKLLLSTFVAKSAANDDWYIDSGASAHITMNRNRLSETSASTHKEIVVGNSSRLPVECVGDAEMTISNGNKATGVTVKDVLCVPDICANLLSVSQMTKQGKTVVFDNVSCRIYDEDRELMATAPLVDDMYQLNGKKLNRCNVAKSAQPDQELWHRRMGHTCHENLLSTRKATVGMQFTEGKRERCITCVKGKQTRSPFGRTGDRAVNVLDLIHSDVLGPISTASFGGARYLLTFVDDCSRKVFVFPMKAKSQVFDLFASFKQFVETQQGRRIKVFRSDNGTEYCNRNFAEFTKKHGIHHQKTVPYTPEQNGVAERMNRSLIEKVRCMLLDASLSKVFWAEAASTAAYLLNRIPCRGNDVTPEEIWSKKKPDLKLLRVFGSKAMAHIPKEKRQKLDPKSFECVMIGYSEESKAYRLFDPKTKKVIISRDVIFIEHRGNEVINSSTDNNDSILSLSDEVDDNSSDDARDDAHSDSERDDDPDEDRAADVREDDAVNENQSSADLSEGDSSKVTPVEDDLKAARQQISEIDDIETVELDRPIRSAAVEAMRKIEDIFRPKRSPRNANVVQTLVADSTDVCEPSSIRAALSGGDADKWKRAMKEEIDSLVENQTWILTELPPGRKAIDSKWVFKVKRDARGEVSRYKARLVIRGFSQVEGIDYQETYAPVVRYSTIRFLIAMAVKFDLEIHQMDAVTAFLQGELSEEIYMQQPDQFSDGSSKVCRLKKSLYGLKQSSRVWNEKLNSALIELGLKRSAVDQCIYFAESESVILIIAIYVDDLLIFSNNSKKRDDLKERLSNRFKMKDIGTAVSILGMNIERHDDGSISIDQRIYIEGIIKRFNMHECNPVSSPMDANQKLSKDMCAKSDEERGELSDIPYQELIGSIMYAAQVTRPDICFAVSSLSRFNGNFGQAHWVAAKRVLRYLKGTANVKLTYRKDALQEIEGHCDADWAGDVDERRSSTGYVFTTCGAAVSWATKRQPTIALSSTEAEFMSIVAAIQEALWLKRFETEIFDGASAVVNLFCDNKSAIQLATNNVYHARTKHIDVKNNFIREILSVGIIKLHYKNTKNMMADIMTKAVNGNRLKGFEKDFGLIKCSN